MATKNTTLSQFTHILPQNGWFFDYFKWLVFIHGSKNKFIDTGWDVYHVHQVARFDNCFNGNKSDLSLEEDEATFSPQKHTIKCAGNTQNIHLTVEFLF